MSSAWIMLAYTAQPWQDQSVAVLLSQAHYDFCGLLNVFGIMSQVASMTTLGLCYLPTSQELVRGQRGSTFQ